MKKKIGVNVDIEGFEKQVESLKNKIRQGIIDGFKNADSWLVETMQYYMDVQVYDAYISASKNPDRYKRTYKLKENVVAEVIGNAIYIYPKDVPYAERVLKGNRVKPYDYPWVPEGSIGSFLTPRDWITPTKLEIIEHFRYSGELVDIIVEAIEKKIYGK